MKLFKRFKEAFKILFGNKSNNKFVMDSKFDSMEDKYLFDFNAGWHGGGFSPYVESDAGMISGGNISETPSRKKKQQTQKIAITPKEVLNELEIIPTPFSLELLDEKISVLKDKEKIIRQEYSKREVSALIERLENRKKYVEFREFFEQFQNTNDEKIDKFIKKHEFVMKESDIFIPEFPTEAIDIMKKYEENVEKVCGKKPVFYVIATKDNFKTADKKRDPILLVQSPFGFYWQILGAWQEEMLLLSEL